MLTPDLTGLQLLVNYSFIMTFFGMVAGSVFFFSQRNALHPDYGASLSISGVILLIAAMNYYYMKDIYIMGVVNGTGKFPTEFRYIDWTLTVPLMLVKFPLTLGMGPKGRQFLIILVVLSLLMLSTGFIGEINPGLPAVHYGAFGIGCVAWLLIVGLIFFALTDLPPDVDEIKRSTIRKMGMFLFFGWLIYPIGYLMPGLGVAPEWRELIYNVGDLVNKVGLAMFIYSAALQATKAERELAAAEPNYA
jgi:bacteriorhodopsin